MKSVVTSVTTYYPGSSYEKRVEGATETVLKYYFAGSVRIAMRENGTITWLLSDHLGSTSVTADGAGNLLTSLKYTAFGEIRTGNSLTDYQYTGQRNEAEIGLYFYVARFYDPALGRFISADTIVPEPGNVKAYDRFSYVNNNPVNLNDPSGHCYNMVNGQLTSTCQAYWKSVNTFWGKWTINKAITEPKKYGVVTTYDYAKKMKSDNRQNKWNNCGPWSVSGENPKVSEKIEQSFLPKLNSGEGFGPSEGGIQPFHLASLTSEYYGDAAAVSQKQSASIMDIYESVLMDDRTIVDISVINENGNYVPGNANDSEIAHFARVIKVDLVNNEITLINSYLGGSGIPWKVSWSDYVVASTNPEGGNPYNGHDIVNQWLFTIDFLR